MSTKIGTGPSAKDLQEALPAIATPDPVAAGLARQKSELDAREARLAAMESRIDAKLAAIEAGVRPNVDPSVVVNDPLTVPTFNEEAPFGLIVGDDEGGYEQAGHIFNKAKQYLRPGSKGSPKPFNIRLVGVIRTKVAA